jgi:hypothetical protein
MEKSTYTLTKKNHATIDPLQSLDYR